MKEPRCYWIEWPSLDQLSSVVVTMYLLTRGVAVVLAGHLKILEVIICMSYAR
jgi:hypothetical protein